MKKSKQYLSIVENHIQSLQSRLTSRSLLPLEREFIERKIMYLQSLKDLPLLVKIKNLSEPELAIIQKQYGVSKENAPTYLMRLFQLEKLDRFIRQPKIVPLEYMKEAIIEDFDSMNTLIELQSRNIEYERKKQKLYGNGLNNDISYAQLNYDHKRLNEREEQMEGAIEKANRDYDIETLKELQFYSNHKKSLPSEFLQKHKNKVTGNAKFNRLTNMGILGKLDKLIPFRKKREQAFLKAVLDSYKNDTALSTLGIKEQDIMNMNDHQMKSLGKRIKKQTTYHRNKIAHAKEEIKSAKTLILKQIKEYQSLQEQDKAKFMELLSTKTNFLPKMFREQIWNEPNLKESLILLACYKEEKALIEQLSAIVQNKTEISVELSSEKPKTFVKQVA